jgi:hypothetical protein
MKNKSDPDLSEGSYLFNEKKDTEISCDYLFKAKYIFTIS